VKLLDYTGILRDLLSKMAYLNGKYTADEEICDGGL